MAAKNGSLSINSENIFPIIKKWLYSDHDIFYRELISNGCDAVTKLKKLDMMGEYALPEGYKGRVDVIVDPEKKTLTFKDNGLGMTDDEVEEYINQIAFSGATDFIEKYKDKSNSDQIIGHFGLGFYSAFMVADEVHIDTLSYKDGAKAVHWECDGGTEFSMEDGDKTDVGTTITLFLNEDCLEFCNEYKAREVVKKYCSFMPTEIYLSKANTKETQIIKEEEKLPDDEVLEEIEPEKKEKKPSEDLFYWLNALTTALVSLVLVFTFIGRLTRVQGESMTNTLQDQQLLLVWSLGYEPKQGDIVVLNKTTVEHLGGVAIVKRVIATGGQTVDIDYESNSVYVDGVLLDEPYIREPMDDVTSDPNRTQTHFEVPEGEIFVMGDNRNNSDDSRDNLIGPIDEDYVLGKAFFSIFPFSKFGSL